MVFDNTVPNILLKLIDTYGISLLQDTSRFESMLRDVLPDKPKELYLLTLSLHEEGLFSFTNREQVNIDTIVFEKHKKKLQEEYFLVEEAVEWIVAVWKFVLVSHNLLPEVRSSFEFSFVPVATANKEQEELLLKIEEEKEDLSNELEKEHDINKKLNNEISTVNQSYRKLSKDLKEVIELKRSKNITIHEYKKKIVNLNIWLVVLSILLISIIPVYEVIRMSTTQVRVIGTEEFDNTTFESLDYSEDTPYRCSDGNIALELHPLQRVWVSAKCDERLSSQTLEPNGMYLLFYADNKISLSVGNAGGLELSVNGVFIRDLGDEGEVIDVVIEYCSTYIKVTKSNDRHNPLILEF